MRTMRSVGWSFCGLMIASALSAQLPLQLIIPTAVAQATPTRSGVQPSYIKFESGTLAAGGVDDLIKEGRSLALFPEACTGHVEIRLGVGFVVDKDFGQLDISGIIDIPIGCRASIRFRNVTTGMCDAPHHLEPSHSNFHLKELPIDSATYVSHPMSVVELCLWVRCNNCGPPPTDKDAVSVQELSIDPIVY